MTAFIYTDVAVGKLANRNNVMPASEAWSQYRTKNVPVWWGVYRFAKDYLLYSKQGGTVKGYTGESTVKLIPFDIDGSDLDEAGYMLADFLAKCEADYGLDQRSFSMFFSGKKGYHLYLPVSVAGGWSPSIDTPARLKQLCIEMGSPYIDESIYDQSRLIRMPSTPHQDTGLYSNQFTMDKYGQLADMKVTQYVVSFDTSEWDERNTQLEGLKNTPIKRRDVAKTAVKGLLPTQTTSCKKQCLDLLVRGSVMECGRNNAAMRIASYLRVEGLPMEMARAAVIRWNEQLEEPAGPDEIARAVEQVYHEGYEHGCNDQVLAKICKDQALANTCTYLGRNVVGATGSVVRDAKGQIEEYKEHVRRLRDRLYVTGFDAVDAAIRGVSPGETLFLLARAGAYKTALVQTLLLNTELPSVFFSLEMPIPALVERWVSMMSMLSGREIEARFDLEHGSYDPLWVEEICDRYMERMAHVVVDPSPNISLDYVEGKVLALRDAGTPVRMLGIDYLQRMSSTGKGRTEEVGKLSRGTKDVAKRLDLPIVCLSQTNRSGGDGTVEVFMDSARESGEIEESADFMFGMWLSADADDQRPWMKILKNRKGRRDTKFRMHTDGLIITDITQAGGKRV